MLRKCSQGSISADCIDLVTKTPGDSEITLKSWFFTTMQSQKTELVVFDTETHIKQANKTREGLKVLQLGLFLLGLKTLSLCAWRFHAE